MRVWLFYKATDVEGGVQVEFRRVENDKLSTFLPNTLPNPVLLTSRAYVDDQVQRLVRSTGWVGDSARQADSEVADVILRGRW